jgi:8-oxo-dGTP pyrophosphatase MutT (NUDIX family)
MNLHIQNTFIHENTFAPRVNGNGNSLNRGMEYTPKPKYCNNCLKHGHSFYQCKTPISSFGLIVFRRRPIAAECDITEAKNPSDGSRVHRRGINHVGERIEYLLIRRRDTLGFIDFMRGKYSVFDKSYILNMIVQMTDTEKARLVKWSFNDIWRELWGDSSSGGGTSGHSSQYRAEEQSSRDKFQSLRSGILLNTEFYTLEMLVESTRKDGTQWEYAEWGFPKGRRNYQEKDYDCAVREFCEETGYSATGLIPIQNIAPYEEIFTGSNYKSYKHKYYLTYMPYEESLRECAVQSSEVSCAEWKSYEECVASIRYYNVEKLRVLEKAHHTITRFLFSAV